MSYLRGVRWESLCCSQHQRTAQRVCSVDCPSLGGVPEHAGTAALTGMVYCNGPSTICIFCGDKGGQSNIVRPEGAESWERLKEGMSTAGEFDRTPIPFA